MHNPKYLALATIIFWSIGPLLTRLISINSQLFSLNLLFFFTFLVFLIYSFFHYRNKFWLKIKQLKFSYLFFGLFGYFFYYLGLVQSFHLFNSGSETTILNYTFPLFTVILSELIFGHKSRRPLVIKITEYLGTTVGFLAVITLADRKSTRLNSSH